MSQEERPAADPAILRRLRRTALLAGLLWLVLLGFRGGRELPLREAGTTLLRIQLGNLEEVQGWLVSESLILAARQTLVLGYALIPLSALALGAASLWLAQRRRAPEAGLLLLVLTTFSAFLAGLRSSLLLPIISAPLEASTGALSAVRWLTIGSYLLILPAAAFALGSLLGLVRGLLRVGRSRPRSGSSSTRRG